MTLEEIRKEKTLLQRQVDLAVKQFMDRCGLEEWQIKVVWGQHEISTQVGDQPPSNARAVFMASVSVAL